MDPIQYDAPPGVRLVKADQLAADAIAYTAPPGVRLVKAEHPAPPLPAPLPSVQFPLAGKKRTYP